MPTLLLLGPRFDGMDRNHQCAGQCWPLVREELVSREQRLSALLPQCSHDTAALGVAYFINGRRAHGEELFHVTFMPDDELTIVHAISGG